MNPSGGASVRGVLLIFVEAKNATPLERRAVLPDTWYRPGGGCEGGGWLLKFCVCWDAAVCAISAGGFFSVWNGVRNANV
jgi:hypothetical protein